ncbi:MAG: hypothetical protein ACRDSR_23700 [Pseudonocardiaceae bacterium]
MENLAWIVLTAVILVGFGVLLGCTLSERLLDARDRRQAAVQRALNEQRRDLEAARRKLTH